MFFEVTLNLSSTRLMIHKECLNELEKFKVNPKHKNKIEEKMMFNLIQINDGGSNAIHASPNMEFLKQGKGFCSMKIDIGVALRILFNFEKDAEDKNVVIFLNSFKEERGKRLNNSYDKGIEICEKRYRDWKEN